MAKWRRRTEHLAPHSGFLSNFASLEFVEIIKNHYKWQTNQLSETLSRLIHEKMEQTQKNNESRTLP